MGIRKLSCFGGNGDDDAKTVNIAVQYRPARRGRFSLFHRRPRSISHQIMEFERRKAAQKNVTKKTYGKKTAVRTAAPAVFFDETASPEDGSRSSEVTPAARAPRLSSHLVAQDENTSTPSPSKQVVKRKSVRKPLGEITNASSEPSSRRSSAVVSRGNDGDKVIDEDALQASLSEQFGRLAIEVPERKSSINALKKGRSGRTHSRRSEELPAWIQPIADTYNSEMVVKNWEEIVGECEVTKIAEASYAEVYKLSNENGSSIFKIITLKPESGPGSKRFTAMPVKGVLSELQVMDLMADVPGFLAFKDAHIVRGKQTQSMGDAWRWFKERSEEKELYFPNPQNYPRDAYFLALELGDAGSDLSSTDIHSSGEIWDIFLGTVIALTIGENVRGFEHRDLHEGNICVKKVSTPPKGWSEDSRYKLRKEGYEVTILDYTLSRANLPDGKVAWYDLESDLALFKGSGCLQYDIYRRMRTWLYEKSKSSTGPDHHSTPNPVPEHSWADYTPYSNVLWLWFLLDWLKRKLERAVKDRKAKSADAYQFKLETRELMNRLNPENKSAPDFKDSAEIAEYALLNGWITSEDLTDEEGNTTLRTDFTDDDGN